MILGGEAAPWKLVRRVLSTGKCAVINHYGPTETTVGSLTYSVPPDGAPNSLSATVPIGRPIANTKVFILDQKGNPVPLGAVGELYIGGAGVARGYWNQWEQTSARFVPHPISKDPNAFVYRTGDLARYLPDGNVEFLGRVDDQVKIRGFRVEPAEIEAVLCRHPAVRQAVVVAKDEGNGDKRLIGYIVPAAGPTPVVDDLRDHLRTHLPDYMIPAQLVMNASLPLTANGKIDRHSLPDPELNGTARHRPYCAPTNSIEETLSRIWGGVLGVERVGIHDDFFDLGGHSLLATQVISRIRTALEVQIPLRTIFETPTIAGLARTIAELRDDASASNEVDDLLAKLDGLPEAEVQRLLAEAERGVAP